MLFRLTRLLLAVKPTSLRILLEINCIFNVFADGLNTICTELKDGTVLFAFCFWKIGGLSSFMIIGQPWAELLRVQTWPFIIGLRSGLHPPGP